MSCMKTTVMAFFESWNCSEAFCERLKTVEQALIAPSCCCSYCSIVTMFETWRRYHCSNTPGIVIASITRVSGNSYYNSTKAWIDSTAASMKTITIASYSAEHFNGFYKMLSPSCCTHYGLMTSLKEWKSCFVGLKRLQGVFRVPCLAQKVLPGCFGATFDEHPALKWTVIEDLISPSTQEAYTTTGLADYQ